VGQVPREVGEVTMNVRWWPETTNDRIWLWAVRKAKAKYDPFWVIALISKKLGDRFDK
jgi:hypothetical protein